MMEIEKHTSKPLVKSCLVGCFVIYIYYRYVLGGEKFLKYIKIIVTTIYRILPEM